MTAALRVERQSGFGAFAQRAWPLLVADEANHTLLLSALQSLRRDGLPAGEAWHSALVVDGEGAVVAAARHVRDNWFLSCGPAAAFEALGAQVRGQPFTGYSGPAESVHAFARGHGAATRLHFDLPLLRLDGPPRAGALPAGSLRRATPADLRQVLALTEAFRVEARLADSAEQAARLAERRLRAGEHWLWLDADGAVAGHIAGMNIAPTGARLGPVYTLPDQRGRGIGAAMVATLASQLRAAGAQTVFLFTDATNPTSNALYTRLGFVPAGRHLHMVVAG